MAAALRFISLPMISNTNARDVLTDMHSSRYTCLTAPPPPLPPPPPPPTPAPPAAPPAPEDPSGTQQWKSKQKKVPIFMLVSPQNNIDSIKCVSTVFLLGVSRIDSLLSASSSSSFSSSSSPPPPRLI